MGTLQFDGTDEMRLGTLSAALQDVGTRAYTVACVFDAASLNDWCTLTSLILDSTPSIPDMQINLALQSSTLANMMDQGQASGNSTGTVTAFVVNTPYLIVTSKAAGTAAPQTSVKRIDTGAWNHATHGTTLANSADRLTASSLVQLGVHPFGSGVIRNFPGHLGIVAYWENVAMDQTQRMECGANNKTSDMHNHSAGTPVMLTELTSTTPVDLEGGWSTIPVNSSPTLDGAVTLGWDFDGVGGPPPQVVLPDADIVTTGWTATPLHSKLADASDATVITATLA